MKVQIQFNLDQRRKYHQAHLGCDLHIVCTVCTQKNEPPRIKATMDGNIISYPNDVGVLPTDLLGIKLLLNTVISMLGARYANAKIANFYLVMPLKTRVCNNTVGWHPDEVIIDEYNLCGNATPDRWVCIKVVCGMYGLPQSGSFTMTSKRND